jgi:hypothetical protein
MAFERKQITPAVSLPRAELRNLQTLKPYQHNARTHSKRQIEQIARSIERRAAQARHRGRPVHGFDLHGCRGAIGLRLVLVGEVGGGRRQREDDVEGGHGQELGLALGEPLR